MDYQEFLRSKMQLGGDHGFAPVFMPDFLFDFQVNLLEWACRRGRSACFADTGLGKTIIELSWAENVVRKMNGRVLILTPLAVAPQTVLEGEKFGIESKVSRDGNLTSNIIVTNYERLHYFNPGDFVGCVCDESGCIKDFDSVRRAAVTEFMRTLPYRLLATATPSPNDYIELGTSSEAIGELGFSDMLTRFFKKCEKTYSRRDELAGNTWRFRGHAERDFWRWVCSWARAVRKPSDIGCDDGPFILPPLTMREHIVKAARPADGCLFDLPAVGLREQREERRRTMTERCERAAALAVANDGPSIAWCHLNPEGDLLEKLIPGAVQVAGKDPDEKKEEALIGFARGDFTKLVTKPEIASWGLNYQHCAHQTHFPSHSFERWYQSIRRSWRFGQKREVVIDIVTSEGEADVLKNLQRKQDAADRMFSQLVLMMNDAMRVKVEPYTGTREELPTWLR